MGDCDAISSVALGDVALFVVVCSFAQAVQRQLFPVKVTLSPVGKVLSQFAQRKHFWW